MNMTPRAYEEARARRTGERVQTPGATGRKVPARLPRQSKAVYGLRDGVLTIPYPPSANRYWRHVGERVLRSEEAKQYIADVGRICLCARVVPVPGLVSITLRVYRPRKAGDLDNSQKILLDAMKNVAFGDDSLIRHIDATLLDDPAAPRVEVWVRAWEGDKTE